MGVRDLAAAAKVAIDTVARFERGDELKERTVDALRRALEEAGVEFTNGGQPGVRLKHAPVSNSDRNSAFYQACESGALQGQGEQVI